MARQVLLVISGPKPGQDGEYNRWYTEEHLGDVLKVPGFVAAQRFKLTADTAISSPGAYLAIYEMDTEDPVAACAQLSAAAANGQMQISPALDTERVIASVFSPITDRRIR